MSSNRMSTNKNTLQLPPQFPSTSTSKSESENKMNLIKIGKCILYKSYCDFIKDFRLYKSY